MRIAISQNKAFTLLEVALAMGIFFMAIFAILSLVTQNLQAVRAIQPYSVDASSLAAELMLTNKVEEGIESGDFGDLHPGYTWEREIYLVSTNGLYQVDFKIFRSRGVPGEENRMSILLYRPESGAKPGSGGAAESFRSRARVR
jgi:Tfp pilus assembly protein PilV